MSLPRGTALIGDLQLQKPLSSVLEGNQRAVTGEKSHVTEFWERNGEGKRWRISLKISLHLLINL